MQTKLYHYKYGKSTS